MLHGACARGIVGPLTRLACLACCAADYAHFLQGAAAQLAAAPPSPAAALAVAALCCALLSLSLWAQAVEFRLPIAFFRSRRNPVSVWGDAHDALLPA